MFDVWGPAGDCSAEDGGVGNKRGIFAEADQERVKELTALIEY